MYAIQMNRGTLGDVVTELPLRGAEIVRIMEEFADNEEGSLFFVYHRFKITPPSNSVFEAEDAYEWLLIPRTFAVRCFEFDHERSETQFVQLKTQPTKWISHE